MLAQKLYICIINYKVMVTINIKENSRQAKAVLEMLKTFAFVEVVEKPVGLGKVKNTPNAITTKQRSLINRLKRIKKDVDSGNLKKFRPINELLDEI